jgi:ribosomal protein S18 acetylase RimI-like enzyme
VATLLVRKAIDYLKQCGVETIKLEAVPEIADLYRRLGFIDEFDSLRFTGRIGTKAPHPTDSISPMQKEEIGEIAKFDAKYFGAYRTGILTKLYQENPKFCFVSHENSGLAGYVMYRRADVGYSLGPFVCDPKNPKASEALLARCIHELGSQTSIHVGVPAVNRRAVEILRDCGFRQSSKSIRMSLGKSVENEEVEGIFAIGGAMKG